MLIRKSLDGFKRGVLALCCFAVLSPSGVYASTNSYAQSDNSAELASYSYDAFGRRIAKTVNGSTTYYLYSGNQLIAELDESGEMVKAYGWDLNDELSSTPLWQAEVSNGKLDTAEYHTLINDHLGTPQMAVNDEGDVTWKAVSESFGKSITDPQNQITMNLRFPGQYYDEETGTHYNYFRDYNPNTGRYIQKDPIGLLGGINEYAYVHGNAIKSIDPSGLIQRDSNGNIIFYGQYQPGYGYSHESMPIYTHEGTLGYIVTDDGSKIPAWKEKNPWEPSPNGNRAKNYNGRIYIMGNDPGQYDYSTNCHGTSFADGSIWINDEYVDDLLRGDGYSKMQNPNVGDIVIYRDANGNVVHSATVMGTTNGVSVWGKGGVEPSTSRNNPQNHTSVEQGGSGTPWKSTEYWRK